MGGRNGLVGGRSNRVRWLAWTVQALVVTVMGPWASAALGGDDPLAISASLGSGMHAYHAGDYQRSLDDLSAVIEAGSRDPRAYYFRGLAALKLGRTDEAEADFTEGSARESSGRGSWQVSRSLERVQGCDRIALERHRARARLVALQRERDAEARRYAPDTGGADVLRRRRPESAPPTSAGPREAAESVEELPAGKAAGEPAAEASDTSDPFGDEPPATTDGTADGTADEKDQQAAEEAAEEAAAADAQDQREERAEAEAEDSAAQQDEREEMEPEAGEKAAEEVKDETTSLDRGGNTPVELPSSPSPPRPARRGVAATVEARR